MIRAFWQSKVAAAVVAVVSLGVIVLIWLRNLESELYIPLVATVLMMGIGYFSARLLGNLIANVQNTNRLGLLHMELNPEAFLRSYADVPARMKAGSRNRAIAVAYLADGYAAEGKFDEAIDTLKSGYAGVREDLALWGLYYNNLCLYYTENEDLDEARDAAEKLRKIVADSWHNRPTLAQNLKESLTLHLARIACVAGEEVDTKWLAEQMEKAPYKLRKLEIAQTLAQCAMQEENLPAARKYLSSLSAEGGKTYYRRWASGQLSALPRR